MPPELSSPFVSLSPAGTEGFEIQGLSLDARTEANGDFTFASVPAGSYVLKASAHTKAEKPTTDVMDLFFGQAHLDGRLPLTVSDLPLNNVRIAIAAGAQVSGHVQVEGDPQKKLSHTRLNIGGSDDAPNPVVQDDQTFSTLLPVGRYFIHRRVGEFVVHKMLVNGRDATDEGLVVSGPGTLAVELLLSKDFGQVEGVVVDNDGIPVPGITVVLIPEEKQRWRADLFEETKTDQKGVYRMDKISPGEYMLFAWKDPEYGIWWDPEFLGPYELKGVSITVAAQAKVSQDLNPVN